MVALFVVVTVVLFVVADVIVTYARRGEVSAGAGALRLTPRGMPAGLFLHPGHAWLRIEPDGPVRVGIDELAGRLLGPVTGARFVQSGSRVRRGEPLFWVRAGDVEVAFPSPVSGTVRATQTPKESAGTDASAWFVTLEPDRLGAELRLLRVAEEAAEWLGAEFRRLSGTLHDLRARSANALPDGGEPVSGLLGVLEPRERDLILREFLPVR